MLTIFAAPKPFRDHVGVIQRNAIRSWTRLHPECQVILCGDEDGCGDVAAELGVDWIPDVVRNEYGTPLVSSAFRQAERHATNRLLCYANADLILFPDLTDAALLVAAAHPRFLAVSEAVDLEVTTLLTGADELDVVRRQARSAGAPRGRQWIDLFVFPRDTLGELPDFAVGRPCWDNWLIWRARSMRLPVVDVSESTTVVHQAHDYRHVEQATGRRWEGPEADRNRSLARFRECLFTLDDVTHRSTSAGIVEQPAGGLRRRIGTELLLRPRAIPLYRVLQRGRRSVRRAVELSTGRVRERRPGSR